MAFLVLNEAELPRLVNAPSSAGAFQAHLLPAPAVTQHHRQQKDKWNSKRNKERMRIGMIHLSLSYFQEESKAIPPIRTFSCALYVHCAKNRG